MDLDASIFPIASLSLLEVPAMVPPLLVCVRIESTQPTGECGVQSLSLTRCCRGLEIFRLTSNRDLMYSACPRQRCRCTAQSNASLSDRLYRELYAHG
jgi:hypothetical protein